MISVNDLTDCDQNIQTYKNTPWSSILTLIT